MPRVIALAPGGRAQAPVRDDRYRVVIDAVRQHGMLDRKLLSPACKTIEQAEDVRRGLYRSARYYCSCGEPYCTRKRKNTEGGCPGSGQRVGCRADVVRDADGKLRVQFRMFDKTEAMRQVVRTHGADPNNWPYYARRKQAKGS
jgi:hypothetical protein